MQRDLPASLTVIGTYLGTQGSRLMQEFLPNTYPAGAANPCPTCPSGFVYLTSNGTSLRHAGQVQVRRRLRNGFTAHGAVHARQGDRRCRGVRAARACSGVARSRRTGCDLDAERGPSNFDQRHLLTAQVQYTTGVGVAGGALLDGLRGRAVQGLDGHESAHRRQRPAADADLSDAGAGHRRHGHHPRAS